MFIKSILVSLLVLFMLSSCGFHPRGGSRQLASAERIFVDASRDSAVAEELRIALSDRGFAVVALRDDATVFLRVTDESQSRRIVSVQRTGKVSEFELSHSVNMLVAQSENDNIPVYDPSQSSNRVVVIREYTYDQVGVLGKEDEERILRNEMREELVLQIVLRTVARLASSVATLPVN